MTASITGFPQTERCIRNGFERGWHTGAQVFVASQESILFDSAFNFGRKPSLTPESLLLWGCASKPLIAVAVGQQVESGRMAVDSRVSDWLVSFNDGIRNDITVRHLLTHSVAFEEGGRRVGWARSWPDLVDEAAAIPVTAVGDIGSSACVRYSYWAGWTIAAELVRRAEGTAPSDYVRREILVPSKMYDSWLGLKLQRYREYGDRIAPLLMFDEESSRPLGFDRDELCERCWPGSGGRGPVRELGQLYRVLLGSVTGRSTSEVISTELASLLTNTARVGDPKARGTAALDWGLGFCTSPSRFALTPETGVFGHAGDNCVGFADTSNSLVVAFAFDGLCRRDAQVERERGIIRAIYDDLGVIGAMST